MCVRACVYGFVFVCSVEVRMTALCVKGFPTLFFFFSYRLVITHSSPVLHSLQTGFLCSPSLSVTTLVVFVSLFS